MGPLGKLAQAADPSAISRTVAKVTARRRLRCSVHSIPAKARITIGQPNFPPKLKGRVAPVFVAPWQNVWMPKAICVVPPFRTTLLGITWQVIKFDDGMQPSCTVPVTPGAPLIMSP